MKDDISIPRYVPAPDPNTHIGVVHYLPASRAEGEWPARRVDDLAPATGVLHGALVGVLAFIAGALVAMAW